MVNQDSISLLITDSIESNGNPLYSSLNFTVKAFLHSLVRATIYTNFFSTRSEPFNLSVKENPQLHSYIVQTRNTFLLVCWLKNFSIFLNKKVN